jgi:hypothetical protein
VAKPPEGKSGGLRNAALKAAAGRIRRGTVTLDANGEAWVMLSLGPAVVQAKAYDIR